MASCLVTMNALHGLGLGSSNSSFSRGGVPFDRVSRNTLSRAAANDAIRCTLVDPKIDLKDSRRARSKQQQQEVPRTHSPTLNYVAGMEGQQRKAVRVGRVPESPTRPAITATPVSKWDRFWAVLERVRKRPLLAPALMNVAESFLTLVEPEIFPYHANSEIQLVDNFAPVTEECPPTTGLEVKGRIPECLNGVYVRNGSNPQFTPTGGYHVFDGDGLIHAVRIKDGVPSYCCRFVRTYRYDTEKEAGHQVFPNSLGELHGWHGLARIALLFTRALLGVVDLSRQYGTANAGLAFYNGKLLAMSEDDMPYALAISPEDGDVHTLGRYDICGTQEHLGSMTAHPKVDPITGELFSYSYRVLRKPHVRFWRATPRGEVSAPVTIHDIKEPVLLHDFAVTENYAIIPDPIMVFRMGEMVAGKSPVLMDESKVARFGVLRKYATDDADIKWFAAPGSTCFHYLNAWEEEDEVVVLGSSVSNPAKPFTDMPLAETSLTEYRMNMTIGQSSMKCLSDWNIDLGRINERFLGRKNRYAYMSTAGPWPKISGLVKFDIGAASANGCGEVAFRKYPPGCYGSEPFFVPRTPAAAAAAADDADSEDDGYIVTFLHNEITNVSELGIFDARSPTLEPVAMVRIPVRVPYGFHSLFITEEQLANQYASPLDDYLEQTECVPKPVSEMLQTFQQQWVQAQDGKNSLVLPVLGTEEKEKLKQTSS